MRTPWVARLSGRTLSVGMPMTLPSTVMTRRSSSLMPTMPRTLPILGMMRTMALFPVDSWAEMIWKVYEADPMICPRCGSPAVLMASMSAAE